MWKSTLCSWIFCVSVSRAKQPDSECPTERVSLLQSHARSQPRNIQVEHPSYTGPRVLLDKVRAVAGRRLNGTSADEDVQALLDGITAAVDTFSNSTSMEYAGVQDSVSRSRADVQQRATAADQLGSAAIADLQPRVDATRAAKEECHQRLSAAQRDASERCSILQQHIDIQMNSCDPALAHGCGSSEDFWAVYDYWKSFIEMQGATIASQRTACDDAQTVLLTRTAECSAADEQFTTAQSNLESHNARCETYNAMVGNLHETLATANAQVVLLQRDHATLALIRCIFDIIGQSLQGREADRTIQSCESDETFEPAARSALPLFEEDLPVSSACGSGGGNGIRFVRFTLLQPATLRGQLCLDAFRFMHEDGSYHNPIYMEQQGGWSSAYTSTLAGFTGDDHGGHLPNRGMCGGCIGHWCGYGLGSLVFELDETINMVGYKIHMHHDPCWFGPPAWRIDVAPENEPDAWVEVDSREVGDDCSTLSRNWNEYTVAAE